MAGSGQGEQSEQDGGKTQVSLRERSVLLSKRARGRKLSPGAVGLGSPAWLASQVRGRARRSLITGARARHRRRDRAAAWRPAGRELSLVGLEPELLEQVAAECGDAAWFEADVTDRDALESAVEGTVERFGGIDVVMANAGIAGVGTVRSMDPAGWERIIEVNLLGVYRTINVCLPHVIERRGYVLPVASIAAAVHTPGMSAYSATKAGVEALGDSLRGEVEAPGRRCRRRVLLVDRHRHGARGRHPSGVAVHAREAARAGRQDLHGRAGRRDTAGGIEARARRIVVPQGFRALLDRRACRWPA